MARIITRIRDCYGCYYDYYYGCCYGMAMVATIIIAMIATMGKRSNNNGDSDGRAKW